VTRPFYFVLVAWVSLAAWQSSAALAGEPDAMTGLYVYNADAALFTDCTDGRRRPLLVRVHGHYDQRPKMEGEGIEEVLIVDEFRKVSGDTQCPEGSPVAVLETEWFLQEITGESFAEGTDVARARIMLHAAGKISGSNGCNRLMGGFEIRGERLTFGPIASTRMACPGDDMKLEAAFDQMLSHVQGWQLKDGKMLLLGSDGIVATFEPADRE